MVGGILKLVFSQFRELFGGVSVMSVNSLTDVLPSFIDISAFTNVTDIAGFAVPTFLIYLFFFND